jgi:hypothetical protein
LNLRLSRHVTARIFQADWLHTQLHNSTTNAQNTLNLGAGIVLRLR